ncbi:S-layer homology domain-containing protein [Peptoniphilus duerdenii]|uniref:S-layer homology domain-containing protein n=1 Tax=Peptoniphilus duerdenii TaxID=507750 RepID=UPI0023F33061|nr:S-layer homology domain-containing protein [Peptoniphilus duerdenii]
MKRLYIFILSVIVLTSTFIGVDARSFSDVSENDWFYSTVSELTDRRIVKGYDDGTFKPYKEVTYAEFFTLMTNATGHSQEPFTIVPRKWYLNTFNFLNHSGVPADEAKADMPISRAEMARFTSLILEKVVGYEFSTGSVSFTDEKDIDKDYIQYVKNLAAANIITGDDSGNFLPEKSLNRAEASQVIKKILELVRN